MLKGINLSLMIGPAVPIAVPRNVIDALTSLTVTTNTDGPSVFQLNFEVDNRSPLLKLFLLAGGSVPPMMRVLIIATVNGSAEVLIDGVMTNHELQPGSPGANATLSITGEDLTRVMDYIDFSGIPYPAMPAAARVAIILAKYAFLGVIPLVIPSVLVDVPIPVDRIPRQQGKDLAYIKALANEVGYVFYIEPKSPGTSVAYWGPEIKVGAPQPALNGDMDAHNNIESINFNFDSESKTLPIVYVHNPLTKVPIPIPVPDVSPLNPPLGRVPPIPKKIEPLNDTARRSPIAATLLGMTRAARSADVITANGSLDVLRYGRVLKARGLVGLRGVGDAFNGLYFVKGVTHRITRGEYKQDFSLTRNGMLSTLAQLPV